MSAVNSSNVAEQRPLAGIGLRIAAATSFAFMAAMVKIGDNYGIHLIEMIFWRFAFALPLMFGWVMLGPGIDAIKTKRPLAHLWRAVIGFVAMGFGYWSLTLLPLAEATALSFAAPLFATLLSALVLTEVVGWHRWGAVIIGFIGVLIVMQPQNSALPTQGLIVALISAFGVSCVLITIRQISKTETTLAMVFWFTAISALALSFVVPFFHAPHPIEAWGIMVGIGLLGGIAQFLLTASLRIAPVAVIAPFDYTQLLWAVLLGWLIWSDIPPAATWIGAGIVIASGLYTLFRERKLAREARPVIA